VQGIKPLDSSQLENIVSKFSPFIKEVRRRIIFIVAVFAIGTIGGFIFNDRIVRFLVEVLSLKGINIVFTSPFQFINLAFATGIATGLTLTFPVVIYQVISFLKPALAKREFRTVMSFLPFSLFLFLVGFISGVLMMKWQVQIFLSRSVALGIGNVLDISHLLTIVMITSALLGIAFQVPIILLTLLRMNIVSAKAVAHQRAWVYLASFIFAILLPPDSVVFDILATFPLIILFEFTLILNKILGKRGAKGVILEGA
jgi:sec-independent protein translocase protein TatC